MLAAPPQPSRPPLSGTLRYVQSDTETGTLAALEKLAAGLAFLLCLLASSIPPWTVHPPGAARSSPDRVIRSFDLALIRCAACFPIAIELERLTGITLASLRLSVLSPPNWLWASRIYMPH